MLELPMTCVYRESFTGSRMPAARRAVVVLLGNSPGVS